MSYYTSQLSNTIPVMGFNKFSLSSGQVYLNQVKNGYLSMGGLNSYRPAGMPLGWGFKEDLYAKDPITEEAFHLHRRRLIEYKQMCLNAYCQAKQHLEHKRSNKTKHRRAMELIRFKKGTYGIYWKTKFINGCQQSVPTYARVVDDSRKFLTVEILKYCGEKKRFFQFCRVKKDDFCPIYGEELRKVKEEFMKLEVAGNAGETKDCSVCLETKTFNRFWKPSHPEACEHSEVCNQCVNSCRINFRSGWSESYQERTPCPMCRNVHWSKGYKVNEVQL